MKSRDATARIARTASAFALVALVAGGIQATREIVGRTWVLEFQAGSSSSWLERFDAIVQSTAIEGFGYMALGAVLALVALAVMRALPHLRADEEGAPFGAGLVLAAGAFFGWIELAWIAEDALAFMTRANVVVLDVAAVFALLVALALFDLVARRCPWSPRASEANAAGSLVGAAIATWFALRIVRGGQEGWRDPMLLATAGVVFLAALPIAGLVARLLDRPLAWLRARLRRGPLLPRAATAVGWLLLLACGAWTVFHFQFSPLAGKPHYAKLGERPPVDGPNVVFVTIDTLRADHLGCYGYPRPTSPFIDSLAKEGVLCRDASAAASWTKPATGTILTGLHPSRHGALYHGSMLHLPEGKQTLAEAFQERGYVTAGFVANPNLKRVFAFDRGFDVFFDSPVEDTVTLACIRGTWFGHLLMTLLRHQFNWNYENDNAHMNQQALAWLDANPAQRFFLYLHYIDPHIPYDPPSHYREEFEQDHGLALFNERKRLVGTDLYDGEIRYTDDGVAALVAKLRALGAWENTLFVLTSDHGEEFFEHGVLGHGFSLYQEVVHVPLILRGPGVPAGAELAQPVQILDLAATVLALAGAEAPDANGAFGDGNSFSAQVLGAGAGPAERFFMESEFGQDESDQRAFVFTGLRQGEWKLVLTEHNEFFPPTRYGREALYDLASDPSERRNLFRDEAHQGLIRSMLEQLRGHAQFLTEHGFRDIAPAALTPELEAELQALGYIGGGQ